MLLEKPMERRCAECGETVTGRIDKRFCSDQCRNSFNNKNNSDSSNLMRNINHALRKNRRILAELNPEGKITLHRDKLLAKGYNFNYHTHIYTTRKGDPYYFVYDMGFLELPNNFFMLVKRNPEE